ncbi:MAG: DUF983 domain-containing protein [Acidimicrobiia bacterium]|nr:DUF983 domain-containing protein [Acidimicrobiia bacterium]
MTQRQLNLNHGWWRGAARALLLRCPRCGQGKVFRRFVIMNSECSACDLTFDRGSGYWLGSMMFNMAFAMGTVVAVFVLSLILTSPDPDWDLTVILVVVAALVSPLVFFPFSRTLWVAAERAARLRDGVEAE